MKSGGFNGEVKSIVNAGFGSPIRILRGHLMSISPVSVALLLKDDAGKS